MPQHSQRIHGLDLSIIVHIPQRVRHIRLEAGGGAAAQGLVPAQQEDPVAALAQGLGIGGEGHRSVRVRRLLVDVDDVVRPGGAVAADHQQQVLAPGLQARRLHTELYRAGVVARVVTLGAGINGRAICLLGRDGDARLRRHAIDAGLCGLRRPGADAEGPGQDRRQQKYPQEFSHARPPSFPF